jgi:hypothetical protein
MNDSIAGGSGVDTITISADWNTGPHDTGIVAQEISTINLGDINLNYSDSITFAPSGSVTSNTYSTGVGGTITISGIDDFAPVTRSDHNELIERISKLEAALTEEAELRAKHPAVKTAYDEYRLLLVLAKQHTPDILTDE